MEFQTKNLLIPSGIVNQVPLMVKTELAKLPAERQEEFVQEFKRKRKSTALAYLLWLFLGFHYLYLGKIAIQIFFWLTLGGMGIWWFIDLFRTYGMVNNHNKDMSVNVLRDIKIISS